MSFLSILLFSQPGYMSICYLFIYAKLLYTFNAQPVKRKEGERVYSLARSAFASPEGPS